MASAPCVPPSVSDIESIERVAENKEDRRLALDLCLANFWPNEDIASLERVDTDNEHAWKGMKLVTES